MLKDSIHGSFCYSGNMAAPITHILFALQLNEKCTNDFILGVSFPDIRYLGVISREATHSLTLKNIVDSESFTSGMAFHQYIDHRRREYWHEKDIYNRLPASPYISHALKFLEDVILYDRIEDWSSIGKMFKYIPEEEQEFAVPLDASKRWHKLLSDYIVYGPSFESIYKLTDDLDPSGKITSGLQELMPLLVKDEELKNAINHFYDEMNKALLTLSLSKYS